jgi:3-deoxy-D-arabino-heptulosonate 7-phosphate (DAHP) synthase class II
MTYPRLPAAGRPVAAALFRQVRQRLAYVRQQEQALPQRRTCRDEMQARTCERIRRETRLQLQAMRRLLHALFG